jgi:signal transduction histidine kinase
MLAPLAWLQYTWIDRIAVAERDRLRAYVQSSALRFAEDMDGYLAAQPFELVERPPGPPEGGPPGFRPGGPPPMDAMFIVDDRQPGRLLFRVRPPLVMARVDLDMKDVTTRLLPQLYSRHLQDAAGVACDAVVVANSPMRTVIWRSGDRVDATRFEASDVRVELLHFRLPRPGIFNGPPPPGGAAPWRLLVRPREGSLDAVVGQTRMRNLLLSGGILLLLGIALAAVVVTTRRAQELARLQMEFVAGVSHELRTPLAVIGSAADNLADGVVRDDGQMRQYGALIRAEGRRLSAMVEQILGYAKIQNGRARHEPQPLDVDRLIAAALAACEAEICAAGMEVETQIDDDLPPVMADPASLTHGLRNLIANAATHGASGHWMRVRAVRRQSDVEISVADHGPGLPSAELAHLFEPFYRGRRAVEEQVRGFGLGLALAQRIASAHRGSLSVESAQGVGTTFTLRIPLIVEELDS